MTQQPQQSSEPTLADVFRELVEIKKELAKIEKGLAQTDKWQDRTWDVIKWVGGISAGLAISAAIALVGIVLKGALTGQ